MKKYSRLRAVIDLDAVMYNMEMMHANIEKGTKMVVVIKTDGYGHGAVPISRMLEAHCKSQVLFWHNLRTAHADKRQAQRHHPVSYAVP